MKYIILLAFCLSATACVQEGPPYDTVRNQRAQDNLRDTDDHNNSDQGYYDSNGVWHDEYEHGHDHVARHDD